MPISRTIAVTLLCAAVQVVLAQSSGDQYRDESDHFRKSGLVPLYGEQDGTMEPGPYVVIGDVVVKRGQTLSFQPGATIVVKKDAKIIVQGTLTCDGSPRGTVTFTHLANDKHYIPLDSAVDARWDGIVLEDSAELEMRYTNILDSKYGIEAKPGFTRIVLDTVLFRNNKLHNLTIGGSAVTLQEGKYTSFQAPEVKKVHPKWTRPARIAFGGVAVVGAGLAVYGFARSEALYAEYNDRSRSPSEIAELKRATTVHEALGWVGAGLGALGAVGFGVTFAF